MKARFFDHQDGGNISNGKSLEANEAVELLRGFQGRPPFFCSLESEAGILLVGVGKEMGCVQFTPHEGGPPYMMATTGHGASDDLGCEFLSGGTPSPVPSRYCIQWCTVEEIVKVFLEHDHVPSDIAWEEI